MCSIANCADKDKRIKVRPCPDWPGYYITTDGELYRVTKIKPMKNKKGYVRASLSNGTKRRVSAFIHRLVAAAFDKRRTLDPKTETVDHNDGNESHNCRHNLDVVTNAVNIHRRDNGYNKSQIDITQTQPGDPF